MILDQKLPDNPPFRLRKLEKALQDSCSSTVATEGWKSETGEAFLLETLVILFHSNFTTDTLERIRLMVLSGTSAANECGQKPRGSGFSRLRHDSPGGTH
jgi:hypothetical protein